MSSQRARVLVVGFDAMDPTIAGSLARAGKMPALRALLDAGAWSETRNPPGMFVGALWVSFATGVMPGRHGFYCWRQLVPETYDLRYWTPERVEREPFWATLAAAGLRCAVLDAPLTRVVACGDGLQLIDWGTHDRMLRTKSWPASFVDDVHARFGTYPLERCDDHRGKFETLRDALIRCIEQKAALSLDVLDRGGWDLFVTVFAESHCAGHQFWHVRDGTHPQHDAALAERLGDPLADVYSALDAALAQLLARADDDTTVLVLLSHGFGPHYDGDHLLGPVLTQLDEHYGGPPGWLVTRERLLRRLHRVPQDLRLGGRRLLRRPIEPPMWPADSSRRFFKVPNNTLYGGIRVNLRGREPRGRVAPGAELDRLCDRIRGDLVELVDPGSGRPLVRDVWRTAELYEDPLMALPDLVVDWHRDAPIIAAYSPKIGTVRGEYTGIRTGDHRPAGLLLARGRGIRAGRLDAVPAIVDLAPTIASHLGVELRGVDGTVIESLAGDTAPDAQR